MSILRNGTPVKVVKPRGALKQYKGQAGIVKDDEVLWGGVMSYCVELDGGKRVWFDENELKVLR